MVCSKRVNITLTPCGQGVLTTLGHTHLAKVPNYEYLQEPIYVLCPCDLIRRFGRVVLPVAENRLVGGGRLPCRWPVGQFLKLEV